MSEGSGGVLREILARFGFEVDDAKLKKTDANIGSLIGKIKGVAAAVAGGAMFQALKGMVEHTAAAGSEIHNTALMLGVSTDALQEWRAVAEQTGVGADAITMGFSRMSRAATEAAKGGAAGRAFRALGVDVRTATGQMKDPATLFQEVGLAIGAMQDPMARSAAAMQFFGRGGNQLISVFAQGPEALERLKTSLAGLGDDLSGEDVDALNAYSTSLTNLNAIWEGFKHQIVIAVLPAFQWVADKMEAVGRVVVHLTKGSHMAQVAMGLLGTVALVAGVKAAAAWIVPAMMFAGIMIAAIAVAAAIEDLVVTFEGGDTITRRFIDGLFGIGATTSVVDATRAAVEYLGGVLAQFYADSVVGWGEVGAALGKFWTFAGPTLKKFGDLVYEAALAPINALRMGLGDLGDTLDVIERRGISGLSDPAELARSSANHAQRMQLFDGLRQAFTNPISAYAGGGTVTARAAAGAIQQRNDTNITINAGAAGAEEIGAEVERRIADAHVRHVDAALASMPNGVAGSGW